MHQLITNMITKTTETLGQADPFENALHTNLLIPMKIFCFLIVHFYCKVTFTERRDREEDLPSTGSLPKWLQCPELR